MSGEKILRNGMLVNMGVDLWMQKVKNMTAAEYRSFVWAVFLRILKETPQFSGTAVANWNISINGPNYDYDPTLGDELDPFTGLAYEKGHPRWIEVAKRRNTPIVWGPGGGPQKGYKPGGLSYRDKVYITNSVRGDSDDGKSLEAYMESLQDPGYAARKLRDVNKPYETAQESVIVIAGQFLSRGISLPRVGGEDFR